MTGSKIGVEGAKALSEMLKVNTTLTELYLEGWDERGRWNKERKMKEWQTMILEIMERGW